MAARSESSTTLNGGHSESLNDPKYKKYALAVEKCLTTFDNVHEWADFISFLTKLLKTLQTYMQFKEIPRKLIVAKRLAQCLNPALPNGVHQRALDVYSHVLAVIGPVGLRRDLAIWSSGLFPFFEYAATSVKPTLLNLYDTYYVSLQHGLRPVMKAFVLALLPGLEEETGEFFEKVLSILDKVSQSVSTPFFFQNLWLILITSPAARGSALNYLSRRIPRASDLNDLTSVVGSDIGLMIRAFSAALEDEHLLVKRGVLDLMNQSLRLDGRIIAKATLEDREILMRAAVSVVLRRDVSLNRRVNTWLLGSLEDSSEIRSKYYQTNSLQLLASTLRTDMLSSASSESMGTRPFKIFISLLDSWEIGTPLTEILILDALSAPATSSDPVNLADSESEIFLAASGILERAEPTVVWKHLLNASLSDIRSGTLSTKVQRTLQVVFIKFRNHDEEASTVHIPLFVTNVLLEVTQLICATPTKLGEVWIGDLMNIVVEAFGIIPSTSILNWQSVASELDLPTGPSERAARIYGADAASPNSTYIAPTSSAETYRTPFSAIWGTLIELSSIAARSKLQTDPTVMASLIAILTTLNTLASRVRSRVLDPSPTLGDASTAISWNPDEWLSAMLDSLEDARRQPPFELLDELVTLFALLAKDFTTTLSPPLLLEDRTTQRKTLKPILRYFTSERAPYHARAVQLFWILHSWSRPHDLEALVAETMVSRGSVIDPEAFEAFGVLWRFSEDSALPGFQLKIPLMAVLDALRSDNPCWRRIGETWMRGSLKSYLRVLDPILFELVSPSIIRTPSTAIYHGRTIRGYQYPRPFDQRALQYALENLLAVVRFGGQGFVRIARTSSFARIAHSSLQSAAASSKVGHSASNYLDILVETLLLFLQSEPIPSLAPNMLMGNLRIQSVVLELLQAIVARGELDPATLESTESVIVTRLFAAIHSSKLDLQNKLLHVLHSVIFASSGSSSKSRRSIDGDTKPRGTSPNPLFVQTLIDGISKPGNRPVLQHWIDFIMMTIPQFKSLSHVVTPLCECVCRQLRLSFGELEGLVAYKGKGKAPMRWNVSDVDILLLLNALERLVLLSLAKHSDVDSLDDEFSASEKPVESTTSGILGYVFGSDNNPQSVDEQSQPRSTGFKSLHEAVRMLHALWTVLGVSEHFDDPRFRTAFSSVATRVRGKSLRTLEHLLKAESGEVLEALVECWNTRPPPHSTLDFKSSAIAVIDELTSSAQIVIQMLCNILGGRLAGGSKRPITSSFMSDVDIFAFMESYLQRLEGPIAIQIWPTIISFAKEILASQDHKAQMLPLLRCLTALCDKLTQTSAFEDRKARKELQETFTKALDGCILISGRSFEQGTWLRKGVREKETIGSGRSSPTPPDTDSGTDEKANSSVVDLGARGTSVLIDQINKYLGAECISSIRRILVDNDKVSTICANIVYYIIAPAMKARSSAKNAFVDDTIMTILAELTKIPAAAKSWRPVVLEAFNDSRFFNLTPASSAKWRPLIGGLINTDKQNVMDLIGKMASAPSANIFTSRDTEMLLRSINLRRVSYAVFTGERNQFLAQLPLIQEKLVDILRPGVVSPVVHSEVYLCMRVLLCRLSPHNLSSFWPIILTELFRLFQQLLTTLPPDNTEDLQLILSACKFLDLLIVLQTEEFQVHQWMFITDTVDAVYRTDDSKSESLMDLLTDVVSNIPSKDKNGTSSSSNLTTQLQLAWENRDTTLRRPLLNGVTLSGEEGAGLWGLRALQPFFSHISLYAYEGAYGCGMVDWEAVENGLVEDLFDGR